jgi:small subunit ribosomal protein S4
MSHRTKFKIQRALGLELPGLGKPGALEKRAYPPGQHGQARRPKLSEYGLQLREKQKTLFHYGLREEQLRRFVRDGRRTTPSNWINALIGLLERRLDNLVFRLGFARSIAAARQLVSHGHVLVNGRILTIGSAVIRIGSHIALTEYAAGDMTLTSRSSPRLPLPEFLEFLSVEGAQPNNTHGILRAAPAASHIPFEFEPQRVAEYYAQRGI